MAILPFVDASAHPLATACAKGLTDELIYAFTKIDGFRVVDERSGSQAAFQTLATSALAQNLGVQMIVEGTVRIEGDWLRVTAQLVNPSGFQVWSQRFQAKIDPQDFSPTLERIASALVSRVQSSRTSIQQKEMATDTFRFAVHRDLLTAEALIDERTPEGLTEALRRFNNIVQLVPRYARAHADIALCFTSMAVSGAPGSALAVSRGKEAVKRAIELESEMIAAQSCLGNLLALDWNWDEAEACFRYALSLGSYALSERQFALFLCALQHFDEAWFYLQGAERSDPFSHRQKVVYSEVLYLSREFEEIEHHAAEDLMYGPPPLESKLYLALAQARLGRVKQASSLAHVLRREAGGQPASVSRIAEILALCGERDAATRLANEGKLFTPPSPVSRFRQARLLLALGNDEDALSALSTAMEEHEAELVWLATDPGFDTVRESGIFQRILSRVMPKSAQLSQGAAV